MKLFAFDIDGTLYDHSSSKVPDSALEAVRHLREQGHIVGVSTGRNKRQLEKAIDPNEFDFIILCNGGYLEIGGKKILNTPFSENQKKTLIDLFESLGYEYGITTHHHLYAVHPMSDNVQRIIQTYHVLTPEQHDNLQELDVYQFSLYEDASTYEDIKHLEGEYQIHSLGDYGFDLVIPGVNKATMLQEVANYFSVDMKDTIAFGDSDNDAMLLKEAGIGIVMKNGTPLAKQHADCETDAVYNDGIYKGIQKLGYINKTT